MQSVIVYFLRNLGIDNTSNIHLKYAPDRLLWTLKMQKVPGVGGGHPSPPNIFRIPLPTCDVPNTSI